MLLIDLSPAAPYYLHALSPTVARATASLIKASAAHLTTQPAWNIVLQLLANTCSHPHAVPAALDSLLWICRDPGAMCEANFMETVACARSAAAQASAMLRTPRGERPFGVEEVRELVSALEGLTQWLVAWWQGQAQVRVLRTRKGVITSHRYTSAEVFERSSTR